MVATPTPLCATLPDSITISPIGTYISGADLDAGGAEVVDYDPCLQVMYITDGAFSRIDVVDISNPAAPTLKATLPTTPGFSITSVTTVPSMGLVAASLRRDAPDFHLPGQVVFFEYKDGTYQALGAVMVGSLPDMITVSPDFKTILVANEGQPDGDIDTPPYEDPDGSITLIDISHGAAAVVEMPMMFVKTLTFDYLAGTEDALRAAGVRIAPGLSAAQDFEPEYITVTPDSTTAFVTLQENNAVAKVDLVEKKIVAILPLGYVDHSVVPLDPSDRDDAVTFRTLDGLLGMRMPDSIASYVADDDKVYFVTANEGDARDYGPAQDEERIEDIIGQLDATAFPDTTDLADRAIWGRLAVSAYDGQTGIDTLYSFGTRSFSIFDDAGNLVFDSGMDFELYTLRANPAFFNANNDEQDSFDSRSDAKGPEPEAITVGTVGDRIYAFIGLERVGGVMIYDVTVPAESFFVDYVNNRDFTVDDAALATNAAAAGDLGPEGFKFIPEDDSPIKDTPLLLVANEVSGTTTVYEIKSTSSTGKGKGKGKGKRGGKSGRARELLRGDNGEEAGRRSLNGKSGGKGKGKGGKGQCPKY